MQELIQAFPIRGVQLVRKEGVDRAVLHSETLLSYRRWLRLLVPQNSFHDRHVEQNGAGSDDGGLSAALILALVRNLLLDLRLRSLR